MFVMPLARPVSRSAAPHFSRVVARLFDDSFDRFFGGAAAGPTVRTPALDVNETDAAYSLAFDLPGVSREQLKVSVEGRRVVLETADAAAATDVKPTADAPRALYRERTAARYARTVVLPAEVDQATSQAKFDNGVLVLTLAKKVPAGATRLQIA
jgi:HSP20 family protein